MLLLTGFLCKAQNPDVLIDSVKIISPYWGLRFESGTVQDSFMNCGSSNVNFVVGQPYLLARFPIQLANMGNSVAYFGTNGQNGITHDPCYNPQFIGPTDYNNIPNFVIAYILDSCQNIINWNRKTDWNIQNNSEYAVSLYNGQITYLTQYFGTSPTIGSSPNILKDWLESKCGPLDNNISQLGRTLMNNYYNNCQVCDSLVLFPNHVSDDEGIIQLPINLSPGNYYLSIAANFYMLSQSTNCYSDSLVIPFNWDGQTGQSSIYPYFANGITYLSNNSITCTPPAIPSAPTNVTSQYNGSNILVQWNFNNEPYTRFEITPIFVQNNTERLLINRMVTSVPSYVNFDSRQLRQDAIELGANNGPAKYKFLVKTVNGSVSSSSTKTKQAINVK